MDYSSYSQCICVQRQCFCTAGMRTHMHILHEVLIHGSKYFRDYLFCFTAFDQGRKKKSSPGEGFRTASGGTSFCCINTGCILHLFGTATVLVCLDYISVQNFFKSCFANNLQAMVRRAALTTKVVQFQGHSQVQTEEARNRGKELCS